MLSLVPRPAGFRRLALATALGTYLLIVMGGVVKAFGAGLACPDWPLCHGQLVPPMDLLVFLEWGHRLLALAISVLTVTATIRGWRESRESRPALVAAMLLLALQVGLGGITVYWKNAAAATSAHLAVAMAFLAVWLVLGAGGSPRNRAATKVAMSAGAALWGVMVIGSYLKSAGGGLACPDWPLCGGSVVPKFDHWLVTLHWLHRVGAAVAGGLVLLVAARAWVRRGARAMAGSVAVLLASQVALGALAVLSLLPPAVVALHLGFGTALFAGVVWITAAHT